MRALIFGTTLGACAFLAFTGTGFAQQTDVIPSLDAIQNFAQFEEQLALDPNAAFALADEMLIQSDDPDLRLIFGKAALEAAQADRALAYLMPLTDVFTPSDPRLTTTYDLLAQAYSNLGQMDQALNNEMLAYNSAEARMGDENSALLKRLDALKPKVAEQRPDMLPAIEQMRAVIIQGNTPGNDRSIADGEATAVTVWFGTNRNVTGNDDPAQYFGTELSELAVGKLTVTIPPNHESGLIERPDGWFFTEHLDPAKHVVLAEVAQMTQDAFAAGCCDQNDRLLFIHGYNVSFHDGALRAAQLSFDLEFPGEMMYYSWPSQGSLYGYLTDASNVTPSRPAMEEYLEIATRGDKKLHIIAHSMGNQYLLAALESFLQTHPDRNIGQLVLAAPDVDRANFIARYDSFLDRVQGVTLYASKYDRALQVSRQVNGGRRLGDAASGVVQLAGMDTVDASLIETDLLGHSYFGDAPQLLGDILGLIKLGRRPSERCGVKQRVAAKDASLWDIQPEGCPVEQVRTAGDLIRLFGENARAEVQQRLEGAPDDRLAFWQGVMTVVDQQLDD